MTRLALVLVVLVLSLTSLSAQTAAPPAAAQALLDPGWTSRTFPASDWPTSKVPEAEAAAKQAVQALNGGQSMAVVGPLLQKAIALDPAHPFAYWRLGSLQLAFEHDPGVAMMRRQTEVAPSPAAFKHGGLILHLSGFEEEAITFFRNGTMKFQEDRELPALLGESLLAVQDYAEATKVLSTQIEQYPNSSRLHLTLGRALLRDGHRDVAVPHFLRAAELEPTATMRLMVAGGLAEANSELDSALDFARRAEDETAAATAQFSLNATNLAHEPMARLIAAWSAVARVQLRRGEFADARAHALAGFRLNYRPEAAQLVAEIDEAAHDSSAASEFYAQAMAASRTPSLDAAARLSTLVPSSADRDAALVSARAALSRLQNYPVLRGGDLPEVAAGVTLLIDRAGMVKEVSARTLTGPAGAGEALVATLVGKPLGPTAPHGLDLQLFRQGRLTCAQAQTTCRLYLQPNQTLLTGE